MSDARNIEIPRLVRENYNCLMRLAAHSVSHVHNCKWTLQNVVLRRASLSNTFALSNQCAFKNLRIESYSALNREILNSTLTNNDPAIWKDTRRTSSAEDFHTSRRIHCMNDLLSDLLREESECHQALIILVDIRDPLTGLTESHGPAGFVDYS